MTLVIIIKLSYKMESKSEKKYTRCKCCPERRIPEKITIYIPSVQEAAWTKYIGGENIKDAKCPVCQKTVITMNDLEIVTEFELVEKYNGKIKNLQKDMPVCKTCAIEKGSLNIYEYSNKVFGHNPIFPRLKEYKKLPSVNANEVHEQITI
jgi:hypothetical protein